MTFSVIIPTYNRGGIVTEAIRSVLSQTMQDLEVIVVDDGSTDDTGERVKALGAEKVRYFRKENEERAVARNYGADRATGRYLIFLDSDDHLRQDHLETIQRYLSAHAFKPLFLCSGYIINNPDGSTHYAFRESGRLSPKRLFYGNYAGCSAVTVERSLFLRHRFNEHPDLILFEDWELWLRIIAEEPMHCIPAGSVIMTNHAGRSVLSCDPVTLQKKISFFLGLAGSYEPRARKTLAMGLYSYMSLHTALAGGHRKMALRYLWKAISVNPRFIGKRRFAAILRHIN